MSIPFNRKIENISLDITPKKFIAVVITFFLLFILPITIHNNSLPGNASQETYTSKVIQQQSGQVAGISTNKAEASSDHYLTIPLLNFKLDKNLSEPSSIAFTLGMIFLLISIIIGAFLARDFFKKE